MPSLFSTSDPQPDASPAVAASFLHGLNPPQIAAVKHIGGPLILLAGPGTGKTHVITRRIAYHIHDLGRSPDEILAVTFTIKAASELRGRVSQLVGAATGNRVQTLTFNGLGARLMQRFAPYLDLPMNQMMIDQVQSRRLLKELILAHDLFPDLRGAGLASLTAQLEAGIEAMTNLGKTPAECLEATGASMSTEDLSAEKTRAERFVQEARVYELYTKARWERGWTNYSDQIMLPIRLLRESTAPRATLQSEMKFVIVDEFQDCNPAQIELLRLLIGPQTHGGKPELCIVGDDDQAIYGFRGSDDRAFQRFENIWRTCNPTIIALTENHRSQPPVIRVANEIILRANDRFKKDKVTVFPPLGVVRDGRVEAVKNKEELEDGDPIAALLLAARAEHEKNPKREVERFDWGTCAVIARSHGDLDRIGTALALYEIPFDKSKDRSILDEDGVQDVLAWIQWLLDDRASWAARRILMRPPYGVDAKHIIAWEQGYRNGRARFDKGMSGAVDPGSYVEFLTARLTDNAAPMLARVLERYRELTAICAPMRGDDAVFEIIHKANVAHADLLTGRARHRRITALLALLSIAREKQPRLEQPRSLAQFWEYWNEVEKPELLLPGVEEDEVEESMQTSEGGQGRVQLLTAHASKGLQFDLVIVPRVSPPHGYPKSRASEFAWVPPQELFDRLDTRDEKTRRIDEERRLFYVACTRAKRRLVLLAKYNEKSKPSDAAAHFFEELVPKKGPILVDAAYTAQEVLAKAAELGVGSREWAYDDQTPGEILKAAAAREALAESVARVKNAARLRIASALEIAESPEMDGEKLPELETSVLGALQILAAVTAAEKRGEVPAWIKPGTARAEAERIAKIRAGALAARPEAFAFRKLPAPLDLSFTMINAFIRCPRCWYVMNVLELPERESFEANVGSLAHRVLEQFFKGWREAEASGQTLPGPAALQALARAEYERRLPADTPPDAQVLDQLQTQMRMAIEKLHSAKDHILEIERTIDFEYVASGVAHRMKAKLDRIDQMANGGYKVIDYKTGFATKEKLKPKADDLQLGTYYLALKSFYGLESVPGQAEYWMLSVGERGVLPFETIKEDKVRKTIDEVIAKMLAGEFEKGEDCSGECDILGL